MKLDVAYTWLYRHSDITDCRVQSDVFDFAQIPEERLHLVLSGLWCDVRHLDHLRRANRHSTNRGPPRSPVKVMEVTCTTVTSLWQAGARHLTFSSFKPYCCPRTRDRFEKNTSLTNKNTPHLLIGVVAGLRQQTEVSRVPRCTCSVLLFDWLIRISPEISPLVQIPYQTLIKFWIEKCIVKIFDNIDSIENYFFRKTYDKKLIDCFQGKLKKYILCLFLRKLISILI